MPLLFLSLLAFLFGVLPVCAESSQSEKPANSVCSYVANAYTQNRAESLYSKKRTFFLDILGNGHKVYIYKDVDNSYDWSISAVNEPFKGNLDGHTELPQSVINFSNYPDKSSNQNNLGEDIVYEPEIFSFRNKYYILYHGVAPFSVVEPNKGQICKFDNKLTTAISESYSKEVCNKFLKSDISPMPWSGTADPQKTYGENGQSMTVPIGDFNPAIIAHTHISYDHGICTGDNIEVQVDMNSRLNENIWHYMDSGCNDVFPVSVSSKTFIEVTNEKNALPGFLDKYLLTISNDDWKVECHVSPHTISTPKNP